MMALLPSYSSLETDECILLGFLELFGLHRIFVTSDRFLVEVRLVINVLLLLLVLRFLACGVRWRVRRRVDVAEQEAVDC